MTSHVAGLVRSLLRLFNLRKCGIDTAQHMPERVELNGQSSNYTDLWLARIPDNSSQRYLGDTAGNHQVNGCIDVDSLNRNGLNNGHLVSVQNYASLGQNFLPDNQRGALGISLNHLIQNQTAGQVINLSSFPKNGQRGRK